MARTRNHLGAERLTLAGGGPGYDIHRDELDTPQKVLHWLAHLAEKTWVTKQDLKDVIDFAWQKSGVNPFK